MTFEKYKATADAYCKAKYSGTLTELMIDEEEIKAAHDDCEPPVTFVERIAEKCDWTPIEDMSVEKAYKIMKPFLQE